MISIDDFKKVEIRAGKIVTAEKVPDADKLLRLTVDFGEAAPRQIVSGIAMQYPDPAALVGKTHVFITNLEPRTIRGLESQGMILALSTDTEFALLEPSAAITPGTSAR
jgi:methionyl-tRNA synthetase